MAKKIEFAVGPQTVPFHAVHWDKLKNYRGELDYGTDAEKNQLQTSLALRGWIDAELPRVYVPLQDELDAAWEHRKALIDVAETNAVKDENARNLLFVLRKLFCNDKNEVMRPALFGNSCFRRGLLFPQSQVQRLAVLSKPEGKDMVSGDFDIQTSLNVLVKQYANEVERLEDQLLENEKKTEGRKDVSFVTKLMAAMALFVAGCKESVLRNTFKAGTGQKLFGILKVNSLVPSVNLVERIKLPTDDPNYVNGSALNPAKLRAFYAKPGEKDYQEPTPANVEAYLAAVKAGQINEPKVADKNTMKALGEQNPNPRVRRLVAAYLAADLTTVGPLMAATAAHDEIVERIVVLDNRGAELLEYLKAFK